MFFTPSLLRRPGKAPAVPGLATASALALLTAFPVKAQGVRKFTVPQSTYLSWEWTGPRISGPKTDKIPNTGDTYPMTWAADGEIYTSSGDPMFQPKATGLIVQKFTGMAPDYVVSSVNPMFGYDGLADQGPKPTGMISVKGVLYLAFQNLNGKGQRFAGTSQRGADAAIAASRDSGKTWTPARADGFNKIPMFPGYKFGGPAFVNFGKDNAGARDEYVYAVSTEQWDNASNIRVGRVHQDSIVKKEAWSFVVKLDTVSNKPVWGKNLDSALLVLSDPRHMSLPEMVYLKEVKRYLLLTWCFNKDFSNKDGSQLMIYESPEPWGPFRLVRHDSLWETQELNPYCPRLPLKWWNGGKLEGYMQFSGAWSTPHYVSHIRPFRLKVSGQGGTGISRPSRRKSPAPAAEERGGRLRQGGMAFETRGSLKNSAGRRLPGR